MRKWRQQQLEQGANKDLRTQRKTQSDRESRDLWAEFDSYGNLATPKSNKEVGVYESVYVAETLCMYVCMYVISSLSRRAIVLGEKI